MCDELCPKCKSDLYSWGKGASEWTCGSWRNEHGVFCQSQGCLIHQLTARVAALEGERDALRDVLSNAAMCIRRLLSKVSHQKPKPKMVDEIQDWLRRHDLQGSVLRKEPPAPRTHAQ